jgi:hypothetical protein
METWARLAETSIVAALFFYYLYSQAPRLERIAKATERLAGIKEGGPA